MNSLFWANQGFSPLRIRFQIRRARPSAPTPVESVRLYVVINLNGYDATPKATDIEAPLTDWEDRRSTRPSEAANELSKQIALFEAACERAYFDLIQHKRQATADKIIALVRKDRNDLSRLKYTKADTDLVITLSRVYREFFTNQQLQVNSDRKTRQQGQIAKGTLDTYSTRWKVVTTYLKAAKQPDIAIEEVNHAFVVHLQEWMLQHNAYCNAYSNAVIQLLKKLVSYAQGKAYINNNPIGLLRLRGNTIPNPKPLTEAQLQHLEDCPLPPLLRYVCDSWLVAAELCLHYADYMELSKGKIIEVKGGRIFQKTRVKQNGNRLKQTVNVTQRAERILAKYGGVTGLYYNDNKAFNRHLKKISELADLLDEEGEIIQLTFGMGRDSGLTSRAINGWSTVALTKAAGWSNPNYAEYYIGSAVEIIEAFM